MKTLSAFLRKSGFPLGAVVVLLSFSFVPLAEAQNGPAKKTKFDLSLIDSEIVKEFRQAWIWSDNGVGSIEGLVLIYRRSDGLYRAVAQKPTNESLGFTFGWSPDVIAIVHTHPNKSDPKPLGADLVIADRFRVPIFTITSRGMYMYDPSTKKTDRVKNDLEWLDPANWAPVSIRVR
jgi:hypothetical protein